MRKQSRKWLIFGAFLLLVILGAAIFAPIGQKEPTYNGKKLSKWLTEFAALDSSKRWDPNTKQAQALRAIGTNALPWLLSELQADGSRLQWDLDQLLAKQPIIKYRFPNINDRLSRATRGFQALGDLAEPAIPTLVKLVENKPGFVPDALAAIGPTAVPALQQCLTNTRSYPTTVGKIVPIPHNAVNAIRDAIIGGRLSRSDVAVLMPAIRDLAQSTNGSPGLNNYATDFLRTFDH